MASVQIPVIIHSYFTPQDAIFNRLELQNQTYLKKLCDRLTGRLQIVIPNPVTLYNHPWLSIVQYLGPNANLVFKSKVRLTVWWYLVRPVLSDPWWQRRSPGAPAEWSWATEGSPVDSSPHVPKDCPLGETLYYSPPSAPGQRETDGQWTTDNMFCSHPSRMSLRQRYFFFRRHFNSRTLYVKVTWLLVTERGCDALQNYNCIFQLCE